MKLLYSFLAVFLGSGLGGVCRWLLSLALNGRYPIGTLVVNVVGCFLIALLSKMLPVNDNLRLMLMTGFCGAFTTFSTFINENLTMMRGGQLAEAIIYMCASFVLGMLAALLGLKCI